MTVRSAIRKAARSAARRDSNALLAERIVEQDFKAIGHFVYDEAMDWKASQRDDDAAFIAALQRLDSTFNA